MAPGDSRFKGAAFGARNHFAVGPEGGTPPRPWPKAKKEGHRIAPGPLIMKVKNLQRGTADAVELGGKSHHVHQL